MEHQINQAVETLCCTGHRPDRLGGYGDTIFRGLVSVARNALEHLAPQRVLTGMALGWDQAVALAAHDLGIRFVAYVPCQGQESRWPAASQWRYNALLGYAFEVVHVSQEGYSPQAMLRRNEAMVHASDAVLAMYNGSPDGGTAHCVAFAERQGKPIINLWNLWMPT